MLHADATSYPDLRTNHTRLRPLPQETLPGSHYAIKACSGVGRSAASCQNSSIPSLQEPRVRETEKATSLRTPSSCPHAHPHTRRRAPVPVVKDKAACHGAQKQDYGQVELKLLILVLVSKPARADTPGKASYGYHPTLSHQPRARPPMPCPTH